MMRLLIVTSSRAEVYEKSDIIELYRQVQYSLGAIAYNLTDRYGYKVRTIGMKGAINPFSLARFIDEFKPDVIYTYGPVVALHPLLCRRFLCHCKTFRIVHGWDDHYDRIWGDLAGWPGRIFMSWMQKRIVRNSDAVVTLSYELQKLGRRWGVECHYIPNGANPLEQLTVKGSIKLEGRFKVVYTGDKARWKRTIDICRTMRKLPKDIKLYMTGRDEPYLRVYLSDNCISLGWLSKEEQYSVMSQADAFVCTSNQDCNAKLQEYLRWKKPILALHGEADNFFKDGENALLATDGDYAPLVERLANDPELCRRLAENAARQIPVYSWYEIAQQFDAYFRKLALSK